MGLGASGGAHADRGGPSELAAAGLEAAIEAHFQREEAVRRLEKELAQREEAIQEKERAVAERHALELRRMRSSQSMSESISQVNSRIDTLAQQQAQLKQTSSPPAAAAAAAAGFEESGGFSSEEEIRARKVEAELSALRREQEAAYGARAELEARAASATVIVVESTPGATCPSGFTIVLDCDRTAKWLGTSGFEAVPEPKRRAAADRAGGPARDARRPDRLQDNADRRE